MRSARAVSLTMADGNAWAIGRTPNQKPHADCADITEHFFILHEYKMFLETITGT
jgi:hypothetical protein